MMRWKTPASSVRTAGVLTALFLFSICDAWAEQTRSLSVQAYRTEISPGSPEEDALFLSRLVPHLAKVMFGELTGDGLVYEAIEVEVQRRHARGRDGRPIYNPQGRAVIEADHHLAIRGERFYTSALAYLNWRRQFELKWIHDASPEHIQLDPTPFQLIAGDPNLTDQQKIGQTLLFYRLAHQNPIQTEIPKPEYWPTSPILDIESVGVQVWFNLRGGTVTVLETESGQVWQLPFPATGSCSRWMRMYEQAAESEGLDAAAESMREEVRKWSVAPFPAGAGNLQANPEAPVGSNP